MTLLIIGIAMWSATHLLPALAAPRRDKLIEKIGQPRYKLAFTSAIVLSVGLMVAGWRTADTVAVYNASISMHPATSVLMLVSVVLFAASGTKNNVKRRIRHPQMIAVIIWSIAHLLSNGDSASLMLFGGLAVWAMVEIVAINRRDGRWQKPCKRPIANDITTLVAGLVGFVAVLLLHPWISGIQLIRGASGAG